MNKRQEEKPEITEKPELSKSVRMTELTHDKLVLAQIRMEGARKKRLTYDEVINKLCDVVHNLDDKKLIQLLKAS